MTTEWPRPEAGLIEVKSGVLGGHGGENWKARRLCVGGGDSLGAAALDSERPWVLR